MQDTNKPIMLYALPRTRGTAAMWRARRPNHINEPFAFSVLFPKATVQEFFLRAEQNLRITENQWQELFQHLDNPDTAHKNFGTSIWFFDRARQWYDNVLKKQTHEIFVVERNFIEVGLSYILAKRFGWNDYTVATATFTPFEATSEDIFELDQIVDHHVRFYPTYGQVVTFDTLPADYFTKYTGNKRNDQNSSSRYQYIQNIDWVKTQLERMREFHRPAWEDKIKQLNGTVNIQL